LSHDPDNPSTRLSWAQFRFSIIGPLLAAPPDHGELAAQLADLAGKPYRHPTTGEAVRFSAKSLERWLYQAQKTDDPVTALARKVPKHAGTLLSMPATVVVALEVLYREHPRWTMQLHHDNLLALAREDPTLGRVPSYSTVCRCMKQRGWLRLRKKKLRRRDHETGKPGTTDEAETFVPHECRSFEVTHVHGLWHLDFHTGSRKVLTQRGEWKGAHLLGILDDRSRLSCHLQWYLDETAESLVHGLQQALAKRGRPRSLLTDNGSAMTSAEVTQGLQRLGIIHYTTLPYSPEQNAKQEVFWAQVEGRLMAMLEGHKDLTLALLNEATQAWVELEYQRGHHEELKTSPLAVALAGPTVVRPCPSQEELRRAFRFKVRRAVRRSDGTFTVGGIRFELPWRYHALSQVTVRVARWDLSVVDLCDPRTDAHLCAVRPLDKAKNSDRQRRVTTLAEPSRRDPTPASGLAPLLRQLMADYAATGLPPAYLPKAGAIAPEALPAIDEAADVDHSDADEHSENRDQTDSKEDDR
jgi:transposase InsO family protein